MPRSPRLAHKAPVVQVTSMQARAIPAVAGVNTALLSMNEEKKNALYLSVNVFSTKALITSPTGDGTAIYVVIRATRGSSVKADEYWSGPGNRTRDLPLCSQALCRLS